MYKDWGRMAKAKAMYMDGGPSFIYGAQALEAFDQFKAV